MSSDFAIKLTPILDAYSTTEEMRELAEMFEVSLASLNESQPRWLTIARELATNLGKGNTRRLVDALLELIGGRNDDGVAHSTWERQTFHQGLAPGIRHLREMLEGTDVPSEIAVRAGSIFTAKSLIRDLLESATTPILIVDPYIGVGTLDCLRGVATHVRLLTGVYPNSIEPGFDVALAAFIAEGHPISTRRGAQLHDRHLSFNDRCWLVGGSLKDAGKKSFHCMEISDQRHLVVADLEARWTNGAPYP